MMVLYGALRKKALYVQRQQHYGSLQLQSAQSGCCLVFYDGRSRSPLICNDTGVNFIDQRELPNWFFWGMILTGKCNAKEVRSGIPKWG